MVQSAPAGLPVTKNPSFIDTQAVKSFQIYGFRQSFLLKETVRRLTDSFDGICHGPPGQGAARQAVGVWSCGQPLSVEQEHGNP